MRKSKKPGRLQHARAQLADAEERLAAAVKSTVTRAEAVAIPREVLELILGAVPALVATVEALEVGTDKGVLHGELKQVIHDFRSRLATQLSEAAAARKEDEVRRTDGGGRAAA